jgi:hypothetical protein
MNQYGSLFDYIKAQVEISTCEHVAIFDSSFAHIKKNIV